MMEFLSFLGMESTNVCVVDRDLDWFIMAHCAFMRVDRLYDATWNPSRFTGMLYLSKANLQGHKRPMRLFFCTPVATYLMDHSGCTYYCHG